MYHRKLSLIRLITEQKKPVNNTYNSKIFYIKYYEHNVYKTDFSHNIRTTLYYLDIQGKTLSRLSVMIFLMRNKKKELKLF